MFASPMLHAGAPFGRAVTAKVNANPINTYFIANIFTNQNLPAAAFSSKKGVLSFKYISIVVAM